MDQAKELSSTIEDTLERVFTPLKPAIPVIGRFLLVVTFLEDALRILFQWHDQLRYLEKYQGMPWGISHVFLAVNVIVMISGSFLVIAKKKVEYAVAGLFGVIVLQSIGYGLLFEWHFFLRNLSITGGLLMVLSEALARRRNFFPGLPQLNDTDRATYVQLLGRILLVLLFISFVYADEMTMMRAVVSVLGFIACAMVVVGFKAKWSALFLVVLLSVFNVVVNSWWNFHDTHPSRDFTKYDFFQLLSVMGGLLLLVNMGPGGLSMDEKKKQF